MDSTDTKIVSIMPVWEEQNMIAISIASTRSFIYQYIILLKPGMDKTREIIEHVKCLWNLNILYIETDMKLRKCREHAIRISKEYADYYILQDGDEIYYEDAESTISRLIQEDYTFGFTSILLLEKDFLHTRLYDHEVWLVQHPFFFKNTEDIFFPDVGDVPHYDPNCSYHKVFYTGEKQNPLKIDAKIKNFRRSFLREVFTPWHDTTENMTIEEYADKHHHTVLWYRENIDSQLTLDEIIERYEKHENQQYYRWFQLFDEEKYYKYPQVVKKCIQHGHIRGIETLDNLFFLEFL
jgi:hypothetical protein